jgi:hypothetical protein
MAVTLLDRTLHHADLPNEKNNLVADVRFHSEHSDSNFIVELKRKNFPHRAALYSSADVVSQRFLHGGTRGGFELKPVHHISFCDYSFTRNRDMGISLQDTSVKFDVNKAFVAFGLSAKREGLLKSLVDGYVGNKALEMEMNDQLTFFFMLLPYMPPLEALNAHTPSIIKWGSIVAHATPYNTNKIDPAIRNSSGVQRVLSELSSDRDLAEEEGLAARDADIVSANVREGLILEAEREGHSAGYRASYRSGQLAGERSVMTRVLQKFGTVKQYEDWAGEKLRPEFYDLLGGK